METKKKRGSFGHLQPGVSSNLSRTSFPLSIVPLEVEHMHVKPRLQVSVSSTSNMKAARSTPVREMGQTAYMGESENMGGPDA